MRPVQKIASLVLLVVLLVTSTGFGMYTVFCQMSGENYSSVIIEKHCCCQDTDSADKCCDEEAEFVQLDVEASISELRVNLHPDFFAAWVQFQVDRLFPVKDLSSSEYSHYNPPLIERDITVFVQSFLL